MVAALRDDVGPDQSVVLSGAGVVVEPVYRVTMLETVPWIVRIELVMLLHIDP
ncbi:hypothetical protein B005_3146 [Nocardiopsis alba ATCC BAA-2165]|uniref:Uncharacterized protein n=1 Tax=Nocardiopsis alba (strain ATCC BAA-2165 / BE74) TaxID=1205910 RepID=J7L7J8_NOCAA|nr:hypothetical protein B005_3146 [Nocardiopsis alba ATCC BAA-2165]